MWAWIFDRPGFQMRLDAGWSGTMSLPRVLSLDSAGTVHMNPPEEIECLRYDHKSIPKAELSADSELKIEAVNGDSLELRLRWEPIGARQFGIKVRCSPGGEEETLIFYDTADQALKIDTTRSSLKEGPGSIEAGPLELEAGADLEIRVFLDKSVVEVFANGRQAVMRRIYPSLEESTGITLFTSGGPARLLHGDAWRMMPSNPY
jgi:beta-fructofuranosidase